MNVKEIKLSDLQKLALNYFQAAGFLNYVLLSSQQINALIFSMKHFVLIESILGPEIMKIMIENPKDRQILLDEAEEFSKLMTSDDENDPEDLFGSDDES